MLCLLSWDGVIHILFQLLFKFGMLTERLTHLVLIPFDGVFCKSVSKKYNKDKKAFLGLDEVGLFPKCHF